MSFDELISFVMNFIRKMIIMNLLIIKNEVQDN